MKRLILILFAIGLTLTLTGQTSVKYRQVTQDTTKWTVVNRLPGHPVSGLMGSYWLNNLWLTDSTAHYQVLTTRDTAGILNLRPLNNTWTGTNYYTNEVRFDSTFYVVDTAFFGNLITTPTYVPLLLSPSSGIKSPQLYLSPGIGAQGGSVFIWGGDATNDGDLYLGFRQSDTTAFGYVYVPTQAVADSSLRAANTKFVKDNLINYALNDSLLARNIIIPDGIGTPIYDNVQDYLNHTQSSGRIEGGVLSDGGSGTLDISEMHGMIHAGNTFDSQYVYFKRAAEDGLALNTGVNFIIATYNAGNIVYSAISTRPAVNTYGAFVVGRVWRSGNTVEFVQTGQNINDQYGRIQDRLYTKYGFLDRASGGVVSAHATPLRLAITAGVWYAGNTQLTTDAADTFEVWYKSGSATWVLSGPFTLFSEVFNGAAATLYTSYQDGNNIGTLTTNRYGVYWLFVCPEGDLYVVMGDANATSVAAAQASTVPSSLPTYLVDWGRLVGQVVIQKSGAAFSAVSSAFATTFQLSAAQNHASLSNLPWTLSGHSGTASTIAGFAAATGVAAEYTLSGTGTVLPLTNAPTFVTSITTPSVLATANDAGALGASGTAFSDLFLANGGVINWNSGNVTLTHSANRLTIDGILLVDSTFRAMDMVSVFSLEAGKTNHFIRTEVSDADNMRIFAFDNTGGIYKPLTIGGTNALTTIGDRLAITTIPHATTDIDKFLKDSSGIVTYRTGAELLSDIDGASKTLNNLSLVAINAALVLGTSDAFALGSISKMWSDLFLASGGVINWDNGNVTLTHSANRLTLDGILLVDSTIRGRDVISSFSSEAGKTEHRIAIDATDADAMRIYGYDLTGSAYRPLTIGGTTALTTIGHQLAITTISHATTDIDRFLKDSAGIVTYRTGAEVLSDIGAAAMAQTFYLGTTQIAINRVSGAQSLTGITAIDGSASKWTDDRRIYGHWIDGSANQDSAITVTYGGTGLSTVLANSYLKGNGTSALVPRTYTEVLTDLGLSQGGMLLPTGTEGQTLYYNANTSLWTATSGIYYDDVNAALLVGYTTNPDDFKLAVNGRLYVSDTILSANKIIAGTGQGFANNSYNVNAINPIWRFSSAPTYGFSYYQSNSLGDDIRFHFGDTSNPSVKIFANGSLSVASGLNIGSAPNATGDFLTISSGWVKHRTASEVITDLGLSNLNYWTKSGSDLYYSAGKVGVGGAPSSLLHVYNPSGTNAHSYITSEQAQNGYQAALQIKGSETWNLFTNKAASPSNLDNGIQFNNATNGTVLTILNTGDVGINTTTPSGSDVNGTTLQIGNNYVLQNVVGNQVSVANNVYYNGTNWYYATSNYATALRMYSGDIAFHLAASGTAGNTPADWDTNSVKFIIKNSGNVGIGASDPRAALDVGGNIYQTWGDRFIGTVYADGDQYKIGLRSLDATRELQLLSKAADGTSRITFFTGATPSERMRIDNAGNVGIGTTAPWAPVQINADGNGNLNDGLIIGDLYLNVAASAGISLSSNKTLNRGYLQQYKYGTGWGTIAIAGLGGKVGIGTTDTYYATLNVGGSKETIGVQTVFIEGAKTSFAGDYKLWQNQLMVYDNTATDLGVGGAITFSANCGGGLLTWLSSIEGYKETATSGEYGGATVFRNRVNGDQVMYERMRITSGGKVNINNTANTTYQLYVNGTGYFGGDLEIYTGNVNISGGKDYQIAGVSVNKVQAITITDASPDTGTYSGYLGINASFTVADATTITFTNLREGQSGNIRVTCAAAAKVITFAMTDKTIKVSPSVYTSAGAVTTSAGAGKIDVYSWWYDGTNVYINGTKGYL